MHIHTCRICGYLYFGIAQGYVIQDIYKVKFFDIGICSWKESRVLHFTAATGRRFH